MSAAPSPYARQANFTAFEASNPTSPKPGASLDAECNAILAVLNAALERLAEIQRDDGRLANRAVHVDALSAEAITLLQAGWTPRQAWSSTTSYAAGGVNQFQAKLVNITDTADTLIGTSAIAGGGNIMAHSLITGRFTIAAQKTFEVQMRVNTTTATNGWGFPANLGLTEIYTVARFWKIA